MDCETFQNSEIDALYSDREPPELEAAASASMTEHAATCASCAARFERLRATRARVLAVAIESVPTDFESRIMAAVDAGLASQATASGGGSAATAPAAAGAAPASIPFEQLPSQLASQRAAAEPAAKPEGGAKIFAFMSRPSFAVAATFVLVLGAAAVLMTRSMAMKAAPMAASESAPAAHAAQADDLAPSAVAQTTAAAPPVIVAAAPPATAPGGPRESTLALNEPAPPPSPAALAKTGNAESKPSASSADQRAFTSAKALASAGRCGEALPKLEALKSSIPEAELYAARCIATTSGCAAAAPRFDAAAASNAGTEIGSRATIEGAKCYEANGEIAKARQRLVAARDEGVLEAEAKKELDALDRGGAPAAGAAPHGAGHAAPKAARPAPATPAK